MEKEILKIDNLSLDFDTERDTIHALSEISISIKKGETLGLVGESGCGKSTIAKVAMRLQASNAKITGGQILLKGEDIFQKSEEQMRLIRGKDVSMVFQDPMTALNPVMKIGNQVIAVIRAHEKISKAKARERAKELIETVGIDVNRFKDYPHQFSGGMRQRVVIACALAGNPELLIADEPTTALDVTIQAEILDLISQIQKERNMAMLLISHDLGVIAQTCDRVAVLYAGQIVEQGTVEQIFESPMHPYTIGLFNAIPDIDAAEKELVPIKGNLIDASEIPEGCYFASRCDMACAECMNSRVPVRTLPDGHQVRCLKCQEV